MAADALHIVEDEQSIPVGTRIQPLNFTPMSEHWRNDEEEKQTSPTVVKMLGFDEFSSLNVWQASVGELLGTAVLVFLLDAIAISTLESETKMPNLIMAVIMAFALAIVLLAVFPVSGGHCNPVITFSATLVGLISLSRATIYILAQCAGAVLGAAALKAVVSSTIERTYSLGGCTLSVSTPDPKGPIFMGLQTSQALWLEIICTFVLLFAAVSIAFDQSQVEVLGMPKIFVIIGAVLGFLVYVSATITAQKGYAGAGMNPARCLGPAIVRGGHLWNGHWIFWVGPTIACLAFYFYTKLIPSRHFYTEGYNHDLFNVLKTLFVSSVG